MYPFTIIRDTNTVVCGAVAFEVDCSALPEDVHAVQWDGDRGEIEYRMTRCTHCGARSKKGNAHFDDPEPYATYVKAWEAARDAEMRRLQEEAAKAETANATGPQG